MSTRAQMFETPDEFDQELLRNVHPAGWSPPAPAGIYNLVVIGGGTAGLVAAAGAAMLGARVALVEKSLLGGDCTNYGCVPSKALLRSARAAWEAGRARQFGLTRADAEVDFAAVMRRMRRLRARISANDSARHLRDLGVDVFFGEARFTSARRLQVADAHLAFRKAIIATGARAAVPSIPGLRQANPLTNETIFSLDQLPPRLLVLGGGPAGCEMAQAFRRLGSEVWVIERNSRLLARDEADAAAILHRQFEIEGIHVQCNAVIERVHGKDRESVVTVQHSGAHLEIAGDAIFVALGRAPNLEGLDLEHAGVAVTSTGIRVNDRLQTTNRHIYAAGDVCSLWKFTHAAEAMARVALQNALFGRRLRASALTIPWCTYTDPEIAHVGVTLVEAEKIGAEAFTRPLAEVDRAVIDGEDAGYARLYARPGSGRVLGATFVGNHAGESIAEAALAVGQRLSIRALGSVIHPYPTETEAWKRAAELELRSRLQPWVRAWLARYFTWRR